MSKGRIWVGVVLVAAYALLRLVLLYARQLNPVVADAAVWVFALVGLLLIAYVIFFPSRPKE